MFQLPNDANMITVEGSTVDFFEFKENGVHYICFDSSMTTPPHPMVNAMLGLEKVTENTHLMMINHQIPAALFNKVGHEFDYDIEPLDSGKVKIIFKKKEA